ncbi:ornithine carbamoyltransferase [Methanomicrobium sp. W14]|uniref:ornithine carbamoyltransferase n=1 Tax=Methanomicrobium sp. W14 TaxID=2817839 RepID=UPI001AEB97A2|nr:ornithine carbamoyltransferase [Methanomicrobium sp. W14]MBP2133651.1 ornithine carbamoyltransferase [Methanomicrobium sp. W14]
MTDKTETEKCREIRNIVKNSSFTTLRDFSKEQIEYLIKLSRKLKYAKYRHQEIKYLEGKEIALIFEKPSTRTRCSFEIAAYDQGAHVTYLGPEGTQIGHKESIKDTARVLGRLYDAIEYRGFSQENVEILAKYAGVPVYNGLTDEFHPTQILADILTITEHSDKKLTDVSICYLGDGRNNTANSLLLGASILGMDIRICSPGSLMPNDDITGFCKKAAEKSGGRLTFTKDPKTGVSGADFIYTDVWVSMGEPDEVWNERIKLLMPYQVNADLIKASKNPNVKFMHCLPSFHNTETEVGKKLCNKYGYSALETTEDVFESEYSIVFDQAENRMHTIKAVMVATLAEREP